MVEKNIDFFKNFMNATRIKSVMNLASNHAMVSFHFYGIFRFYKEKLFVIDIKITDSFGGACSSINSNYINNCNYDQAYDILQHLYPNDNIQKPNKDAILTGTV